MMKSSVSSLAEIIVKLDRLIPRAIVVNQEDIARVQVNAVFTFFSTFSL
jgi:ferric-dicitrate binding protein FerR (iron transport regulator)